VGEAFGYLYNQFRQKHGMVPGQVQVSVAKQGPTDMGQEFILAGTFKNQRGSQRIIAALTVGNPGRFGTRMAIITAVTAPDQLFAGERATLLAMTNSLNQDSGVIGGEARDESGRIIQYGEAVRGRAKASSDAFQDYMNSIDTMHDNVDKHSAAFSDFLLDQSVVGNTDTGAHKRFYNDEANLLVGSNPDKFQIVPGSQYIKNQDY